MAVQRPLPSSQFLELSGQQASSLTKSGMIAGFLQNLALPSIFHRELTGADFELWDRILSPYSVQAIEYAFDAWGRNGKRFPLPADILELIESFCATKVSTSFERDLPTRREPLVNEWPVYSMMFNKVVERVAAANKENRPYVPLTDVEAIQLRSECKDYCERTLEEGRRKSA